MSTAPTLVCRDDHERRALTRRAALNGIDYIEISEDQRRLTVYFLGKAPTWDITPAHLRITGGRRIRDIAITRVEVERSGDEDIDDRLTITVDRPGDSSMYTLCVVAVDTRGKSLSIAPTDFDPRYACVCFSFKASCASDLDCEVSPGCSPAPVPDPAIDYLAKDYASFRRLLLDRLALVMPEWRDRHIPDIGITLVELLAYVGDQLSYHQDAVGTEAYVDTARRRVSVRRHVRLVDYRLHEGCNARTWVTVTVSQNTRLALADVYFVTAGADTTALVLSHDALSSEMPTRHQVFEPVRLGPNAQVDLYEDHNTIRFYTWGEAECCLPKGATSATLVDPGTLPDVKKDPTPDYGASKGAYAVQLKVDKPDASRYRLHLEPGDVLVFEERVGPRTGVEADADRAHRHAVRLTRVTRSVDPLTRQLVVEVVWCRDDALPFALCLSSISVAPTCEPVPNVSVAHGNVILVDHGATVDDDLGQVPVGEMSATCDTPCTPAEVQTLGGRYRPVLPRPNLTYAEPVPPSRAASAHCDDGCDWSAATVVTTRDPRLALPSVSLESYPAAPDGTPAFSAADIADPTMLARAVGLAGGSPDTRGAWLRGHLSDRDATAFTAWAAIEPPTPIPDALRTRFRTLLTSLVRTWQARFDLLGSGPDDRHFVVEVDDDRRTWLRFGDGDCGRRPEAGESFRARYRVGNGPAGNVGANAITRIVFRDARPSGLELAPRNPMAAIGGTAPEPTDVAKLRAPHVLRHRLERAITAADYAAIVTRDFPATVQGAAARLRWNGVGATVVVAVDPVGTSDPEALLLQCVERHLWRYRRIGHDVHVVQAQQVPLTMELHVCVKRSHLRAHVKAALLELFSNRQLSGGRLGWFHPDRLTFGEGVLVSRIVSAAQAVEGVESVTVNRLERLFVGPNGELDAGVLPLGAIEVARLDNDPDFPEHGQLTLTLEGGR